MQKNTTAMFHFVDDDPVIRSFMLELVPDLGYEIKVFSSATSYLSYSKTPMFRLPTALLTDIQMPDMDGFVLADTLRAQFPYLKIALVTGYPSYQSNTDHPGCFFMSKPFFPADLDALLSALSGCSYGADNRDVLKTDTPRCDMGLKHDCPFKKSQ